MSKSKVVTRMFDREFMFEDVMYAWGDDDPVQKVVDECIDTDRRWATDHRLVFSYEGKFYEVYYQRPATESQECDMFYGGYNCTDDVTVTEVEPVPVITTIYRAVDADKPTRSADWWNGYAMGKVAGRAGYKISNPFDPGTDAHEGYSEGSQSQEE